MTVSKFQFHQRDYILLGKVSKLHGVKGGFSLHLFNQQESVIKKSDELLIRQQDNSTQLLKIQSLQHTPKKTIIYFEGITDANSAQALLPFEVWFARDSFPDLDDGYYMCDLIGLAAYHQQTQNYLGKISSFYSNGAQDVVVISHQGRVVLELPLIDHFFPEIQWDEGKIYVNPPEEI